MMNKMLTNFTYFNNYYLFCFLFLISPAYSLIGCVIFFPYTVLTLLGQFYKNGGFFGIYEYGPQCYDWYADKRLEAKSDIEEVSCEELMSSNPKVKDYYNSLNLVGDFSLVTGCKPDVGWRKLLLKLRGGYRPHKHSYPIVFINNRIWDGVVRISLLSFIHSPKYKVRVRKYKVSNLIIMILYTCLLIWLHFILYRWVYGIF